MSKFFTLAVASMLGFCSVALVSQADAAEATICARGDSSLGQPDGCYLLGGKLAVKLSAPRILNLSASAPNMDMFGIKAVFLAPSGAVDNFVLILPPLSSGDPKTEIRGTWRVDTKKANKFTVEVTDLVDLVDDTPISGFKLQITKHVFTGTVLSNGDIKGKINLAAKVAGLASMSIVNNNYKAQPTSEAEELPANTEEEYTLDQAINILPEQIQQFIEAIHENNGAR